MDVDGVLTNGLIRINDRGIESKTFSTRDGLGLIWVRKFGLRTGVISGRNSTATLARCIDLQMDEVHLGQLHKLPVYEEILKRLSLARETIAYIGDDIIDLPIITRAGISAAPRDAHPEVLKRVDIVLDAPGGSGAVRHFLDLWLQATNRWDAALEDIMNGNF